MKTLRPRNQGNKYLDLTLLAPLLLASPVRTPHWPTQLEARSAGPQWYPQSIPPGDSTLKAGSREEEDLECVWGTQELSKCLWHNAFKTNISYRKSLFHVLISPPPTPGLLSPCHTGFGLHYLFSFHLHLSLKWISLINLHMRTLHWSFHPSS